MTLEEQIVDAIGKLCVSGFKASIHNIWLQCTSEFNEMRETLQAMEDANIICRDDAGDYDIMEDKDDKLS